VVTGAEGADLLAEVTGSTQLAPSVRGAERIESA
jgi:hypothetical protein